jgi:Protein of unknown function (DUF1501)
MPQHPALTTTCKSSIARLAVGPQNGVTAEPAASSVARLGTAPARESDYAMLHLTGSPVRLCDRIARREILRAGALGLGGLTLPGLFRSQAAAHTPPRAKRCIVLFLMGGPPQQSTWDPKPHAPAEVRGAFGPIATSVPGLEICELMPETARLAHHIAALRAVVTGDNAHSSSGYYMLTGQPHAPMNFENANPGAPNNWPTLGALVASQRPTAGPLPAAVRLPHRIFNTDGSVWPGQDSGFLGPAADPWLLNCQPASPDFRVPEFTLPADVTLDRLGARRTLLAHLDAERRRLGETEAFARYDGQAVRAVEILTSPEARAALELDRESPAARERYGATQFGQSVLLARRLVEAGVSLVQVNWFRGADEPPANPCWDSHTDETARLKNNLAPPMDRAYAALISDLAERGMLDDTLVVWMAEFGRSPKINAAGGRDHWGRVFSVALAGGGVRGGQAYGASDAVGGEPHDHAVSPGDLLATIFHCLGHDPRTEFHDPQGRPFAMARGEVISALL